MDDHTLISLLVSDVCSFFFLLVCIYIMPMYVCCAVLDISGSMSSMFERQEGSPDVTKLDVAKKCLQTLTDQLKTRFASLTKWAITPCPQCFIASITKIQALSLYRTII